MGTADARVAAPHLRAAWQVTEGIHVVDTKPKPSIVWPQALVCAQRSAQSQDSSLHIPPGTQAEPPEVLTHPVPVPLASKEHPTRHWQTPVHESSAAGTEKTGLKGELTQGGPLSPEPSPWAELLINTGPLEKGGLDLGRTKVLGTVNIRTWPIEESSPCFPGVPGHSGPKYIWVFIETGLELAPPACPISDQGNTLFYLFYILGSE